MRIPGLRNKQQNSNLQWLRDHKLSMNRTIIEAQCDVIPDEYSERGSALVEFLLVGLPLLIPALIFFGAIHQVGSDRAKTAMVARQALQAFVTAYDDIEGHVRISYLLERYSDLLGRTTQTKTNGNWQSLQIDSSKISHSTFSYSLRCSSIPCIKPGARVELILYRGTSIDSRVVIATMRSYVSRWHN